MKSTLLRTFPNHRTNYPKQALTPLEPKPCRNTFSLLASCTRIRESRCRIKPNPTFYAHRLTHLHVAAPLPNQPNHMGRHPIH
jgi:hypothetical protein